MDEWTVNEASVKYIRDNFAATIDEVIETQKPYAITRYGRTKAYIVPKSLYDSYLKQEETKKKGLKRKKQKEFEKAAKEVFGMWKDREETKDSVAYIRKLRENPDLLFYKLDE